MKKIVIIFQCLFLFLFLVPLISISQKATIPNNSNSVSEKREVILKFLKDITGKNILSGQHNERFDSVHPFERTDSVYKATGKYPALFGIDFTYDYRINGRWAMIYEAERQFNKGALINIMWHACIPTLNEPCIRKEGIEVKMPDSLWAELVTDGTNLNKEWKKRLDTIANYLDYLQRKSVIVLWRPLHEMNQGVFWWGGRPGKDGTAKLYQIIHDYLTNKRGLHNLIWVWDVQDFPNLKDDLVAYNPGNNYWDLLALDFYTKEMYSKSKYEEICKTAGSKPIAIGECGKIPSPEILRAQPKWTFFMAWSDLIFKQNDLQLIKDVYNDPSVKTLDEMPGWE